MLPHCLKMMPQACMLWVCAVCHKYIMEECMLEVENKRYHMYCLRCQACQSLLAKEESCFIKMGQLYCKTHYYKKYGSVCNGCFRPVFPEDWVRKAERSLYHLACFSCVSCKRQLSTGELFGLSENKVYCLPHYQELSSDPSERDSDGSRKASTKRVRTTFTEEQIKMLQQSFMLDCNPDSAELERLACLTGLHKRVIQVWFQNSRARQKKNISPRTVDLYKSGMATATLCSDPYQFGNISTAYDN